MQADSQIRHTTRAGHSLGRGRRADHQARGRQNAVPVRFLYSFVDRGIEAEIVRADNQASQLAISLLRKN
jgi:hypothetical protein